MIQKITIASLFLLISVGVFAQIDKAGKLITEGVALYDQGKYTEALDKYKESYIIDSNNVVLFSEIALTYWTLKDFTNTESICKRAINKFSGNDSPLS